MKEIYNHVHFKTKSRWVLESAYVGCGKRPLFRSVVSSFLDSLVALLSCLLRKPLLMELVALCDDFVGLVGYVIVEGDVADTAAT
jgi:hypothetical protein